MTKSNFDTLKQVPLFTKPAHVNDNENQERNRSERVSLFAPPPGAGDAAKVTIAYGAVRALDGRSARRTGRTVQFGTVVSIEFKEWLKAQAKARGKSMAALLDDMKSAYVDRFGE